MAAEPVTAPAGSEDIIGMAVPTARAMPPAVRHFR
jgi:hypothetical protein